MDLSSTPADSTRFKLRRSKKMADKNKVFKVPNPPNTQSSNYSTRSKQKIRSVAERKSDLLSKWGGDATDNLLNLKDKREEAVEGDGPLEFNATSNIAVKLARFRYGRECINTEGEEDIISLGESAKMTQAKLKRSQQYGKDGESDYNNSEHERETDNSQHEHDDGDTNHDDISDTGTKHTDVSTAQSNIAEQAEIAERRELECMRELVQEDTSVDEVLRFVLQKLTMLQIGIKEIKTEQSNISRRINNLEDTGRKTRRVSNYCLSELQEITTTNFKLIQSTIKQDQDISALMGQVQKCESRIQKGTMTISGLKKQEDEDPKGRVIKFLQENMKIRTPIDVKTAYRLTKFKIAFQLSDPNKIGTIFEHAKNLKGQKNDDNKYYRIEELLPDHQQEAKNRMRDIKKENERMPFTHQSILSTQKGKLYIGEGENKIEWEPPIQAEPVKNYLLMNKGQEEQLDAVPLMSGPSKAKEGSKFLSFAAEVNTINDVKTLYKKLKTEHQMATHIIGAYRIFGQEHHLLQSFCDDGEHGGGRRMLNILKEEGIFNLAIFVVRYKDGKNIGKARFEIITELTKMIIARMDRLDRGERQNSDDKEMADALKKAVTWARRGTQNDQNKT